MRLLIVILLIFSDFFSKKIIFHSIELNKLISIVPFFDLTHIHNYGIAFGLFSGLISSKMIILITSVVTIAIIYLLIQASNTVEKWGLTLIIAGAISNIFDRAINNYVLDFIYLHYKDFYWPAFNFADIYISVGVFIVVLQLLKDLHKRLIK